MILTKVQIAHLWRYFKQKVVLPKVAIIGGYHGGNLGDMALGMAVSNVLNEKGISNGLQTIYNLDKWPKVPLAIVGGGAVGYVDSLMKVYSRYKGNFAGLGFLGVDFNESKYPDDILLMIREAAFVSCRSEKQAERMRNISGRPDIYHHPDIAYSLLSDFCSAERKIKKSKQKKVFVNVLPLYGIFKDGKVEPSANYKDERPELYKDFDLMHKNYSTAIRSTVEQALKEGYAVESAPFTSADGEYCKVILNGLPVKFPAYHADPVKMIKNLSTGERIISTRFHTTIFGLKTGARMQPVAYATKNELMLNELGLKPGEYLSTIDLAQGKDKLPSGIIGDNDIIAKWEFESKSIIIKCVDSLRVNKQY